MNILIVYLNNERVGILEQTGNDLLQFSYDQVWLEKQGAVALSRSLPLRSDVFPTSKARPFFAGILPEEQPRRTIAEILGISESNDFALLERIGGECAGAVSLLPEGEAQPDPKDTQLRKLTESELRKLINELPERPLMVGEEGVRLSLAGAQDKLPIILKDDKIGLPLGNTPSTHILKAEPSRFPGLAANEFFSMTLARATGLNTPRIEYRLIGEKPCVIVQRYDRTIDGGGHTIRIHQEDFCQSLGFPPERKYQAEGGPTLNDCISLIQNWSSTPVLDIPEFINGQIFNVIIGNADAHCKNFAFLYSGSDRRLAPFYDLVSTLMWPRLSKNLAMKIGGSKSVNAFSIGEWKKMAKNSALGWPMIRERMVAICDRVLNELDEVQAQAIQYSESVGTQLYNTIGERAARMRQALPTQNQ